MAALRTCSRRATYARSRRAGHDDIVRRRDLPAIEGVTGRSARAIIGVAPMDDITEAVLNRDEVARFLEGGHGAERRGGARARPRLSRGTAGRRSVTSSIARWSIRSIRSCARSSASPSTASAPSRPPRAGRVVWASNHRSHTDYLVEPLVARRCGHPSADHRRGHQPVRRPAGPDSQARDRRAADPPEHQGSRLPDHAQGLRRRSCCTSTTCSSTRKAAAATAAS